jgi:phosphotransferase system IIB component
MDELEQLNLFLKEYALYLALGGVLIIVISILVIFLSGKKKKIAEDYVPLFLALGGIENVLSAEARGSRVTIHLADEKKMDVNALPKDTVSNYIKMTGKVILVVGSHSDKIAQMINKKAA